MIPFIKDNTQGIGFMYRLVFMLCNVYVTENIVAYYIYLRLTNTQFLPILYYFYVIVKMILSTLLPEYICRLSGYRVKYGEKKE